MKIIDVRLLPYTLRLKYPFRSAHETVTQRQITIVALRAAEGQWGYGELEAFERPNYTPEFQAGARLFLQRFLIPSLKGRTFEQPEEMTMLFSKFQGNQMAKAALETAVWDLFAKQRQTSLAGLLGQKSGLEVRKQFAVGISLGAQKSGEILFQNVKTAVAAGYQRIKIKITTRTEAANCLPIFQQFPQVHFMLDANSAFTYEQAAVIFKNFTGTTLTMLEQPLGVNDFTEHARLQSQLTVPLCLDENIFSIDDVKTAYQLKSCRAINLKLARVGGFTPALALIRFCLEHQLNVWCGGMLESGLGRTANLALASLAPLTFPGDLAPATQLYTNDTLTKSFELENGKLSLPEGNGLGVQLKANILKQLQAQPNLMKD
ncbi:o-succinylbenzoate synthase [Liquorilactobacillus satsumensis]|uniref:o-succinylbenzoate synthase n=1 Tax=Liquorilactobacillus satsumensis TaxID=259059 RepID=UPI001E6513C0|nr:o-succinylbenzoate synthase [Liquorilactobacillus satsumensis]MCC7666860.1 o-succinylbenzoate synthase [Liquorilactobacillus satsumensis]MCP9313637.1 o-succinylbenzoate synthase [Liquorilactobacillus satsumensis]MCP9328641.1 o-succinylbenzoate synthase [Liquorilactobacillus satsumensis]MCP9356962.1 o-succinylbenzoate synthase [Liquorilactobacillus satsumensis]MCP9360778.1 o-succinylbenzoate synthase [Liquorilactobacillus satsumensis]